MTHRMPRRLAMAAVTGLTVLAVLAPAAVLAADPSAVAVASDAPSEQPSAEPSASDGGISMDPTFVTATPSPTGRVLGATGRPATPPPTDATAAISPADPDARSLGFLLLGVAIIGLAAARLLDVRRR